jgi:hypothetical protein
MESDENIVHNTGLNVFPLISEITTPPGGWVVNLEFVRKVSLSNL